MYACRPYIMMETFDDLFKTLYNFSDLERFEAIFGYEWTERYVFSLGKLSGQDRFVLWTTYRPLIIHLDNLCGQLIDLDNLSGQVYWGR